MENTWFSYIMEILVYSSLSIFAGAILFLIIGMIFGLPLLIEEEEDEEEE